MTHSFFLHKACNNLIPSLLIAHHCSSSRIVSSLFLVVNEVDSTSLAIHDDTQADGHVLSTSRIWQEVLVGLPTLVDEAKIIPRPPVMISFATTSSEGPAHIDKYITWEGFEAAVL
jgi:hypothetical protein